MEKIINGAITITIHCILAGVLANCSLLTAGIIENKTNGLIKIRLFEGETISKARFYGFIVKAHKQKNAGIAIRDEQYAIMIQKENASPQWWAAPLRKNDSLIVQEENGKLVLDICLSSGNCIRATEKPKPIKLNK